MSFLYLKPGPAPGFEDIEAGRLKVFLNEDGQLAAIDGEGTISPLGGGGGVTRETSAMELQTLDPGETFEGTWEGLGKTVLPHRISANTGCWIRIYKTPEHAAADAARAVTQDATGEHGLCFEAILGEGLFSLDVNPQVPFSNPDGTEDFPVSITNTNATPATLTVLFTRSILET
jgi:hypothetical protein